LNLFDTNTLLRNRTIGYLLTIALLVGLISSCSKNSGINDKKEQSSLTTSRGEHARDGDEKKDKQGEQNNHNEEKEESGIELKKNATYDKTRNGAHLILEYDETSNSFKGIVENKTKRTLKRVRVEVHLSNGIELGPTNPVTLQAGEKRTVKLAASEKSFSTWGAHPEVGNGEHGEESEQKSEKRRGEHDSEGENEHGGNRESNERHD